MGLISRVSSRTYRCRKTPNHSNKKIKVHCAKINMILPTSLLISSLLLLTSSAKPANQIDITQENYQNLFNGEWLVKFHAPWCPACRALEKEWGQLADYLEPLNVNVGSVDVTQQAEINGRFMVTSLPTIFHFKNGQVRRYSGPRKMNDLLSYVEDGDYEEEAALNWWRHPNSAPMSALAKLYSFSSQIKEFMDDLDKKGYSQLTIFALVGIFTVLAGLFLGLLLVAITDLFWPPPAPETVRSDRKAAAKPDKNSDDEEEEEKEEEDSKLKAEDEPAKNSSKVRKRTRKAE